MSVFRKSLVLAASLLFSLPAFAWNADGHRTITLLGLDGFDQKRAGATDAHEIDWLFTPDMEKQVAYASGEPDRFRAIKSPYLDHANNPDHYIDVEDLTQFGLTLESIPPLRQEYFKALVIAKHEHPEDVKPYNEKADLARQQEFPGTLPFAIVENHAKLTALFRQIRVLDSINDPNRAYQLTAARAAAVYEMGQLSHFVGDAAQPLHTTMHHHGWIGDNPNLYTTNHGFHAYIDGNVLTIHSITRDSIAKVIKYDRSVDPNPWHDVLAHIERSHDKVEELYQLEKSGELKGDKGKAFITERFCDGGSMLAALFASAWEHSKPTPKDISDFVSYDSKAEVKEPEAKPAP